MSEDELRKVVGKALKAAHTTWIEAPVVGSGFPDLEFCLNGTVGQIELKVTGPRGRIKIRNTQYRWFKDRTKAGGWSHFMWIYHDGKHHLVEGQCVEGLNHASQLPAACVQGCIYEDPALVVKFLLWKLNV